MSDWALIFCTVLFSSVTLLSLYLQYTQFLINTKAHQRNNQTLLEENERLKAINIKQREEISAVNRIVKSHKIYDLGFVITPGGVKMLPEKWRDQIQWD